MAPCVEPLEVRLVPTVISHTSDGNLLIETSDNLLVDRDQIEIRADVTNSKFIISDPSQTLISNISGTTTSPDQHVVEIPFSSVLVATRLLVKTFAGDDFIALSAEGGNFGLSPVINGGDGFDEIVSTAAILVATANEDLFLSAENIRLGGNLTTNAGKITLDGNVLLTDNVILTTVGASSGFVQINGQLDSAAGPSNYTLITTPRMYADAQRQAAVDVPGGYLVTIRSAVEQVKAKAAAGNNDVWIGASDAETEGQWKWDSGPDFGVQFWGGDGITGNPVNGEYSNWFPGEPDDLPGPGDAAFLTGNDTIGGSAAPGGWSDGDSNTPRAYIVESPTAFSLTVNSGTADVLLNGSVGNQIPLRFLDVTANRTDIVGGSVSTFKSQTYNSSVALSGPTLLRAEEVNFSGGSNSVSGTANLTLAPIKRDAPITVGGTTDAGTASFDITDTDIAALAIGFASIQIGEPPFDPGQAQGQGQGQGTGFQSQSTGFQVQSTGPVTVTTASFLSPIAIAGGSISVTGLDAGTNKVDLIASLGSITDGGNAVVDITAGELSLDSATGVGMSNDALDTAVAAIAARAAESGDVVLSNTGNLGIGSPMSPGGIFTNHGLVSVATTGSMAVLRSIVSKGGDVRLTATNGIVIDGVPVDTRVSNAPAGDFTADADSDNNGSGTFSIHSVMDFVDWRSATQGVFADGTTVDITTTTLASALAQINPGDTRFSDENIYFPAQASGDFVETRFSQVSEAVFFTFSNPQFGLFLHFDGMQFQGTPFDPSVDNPINLYSFDRKPSKVSGESTWDIDQGTNSIRQLSGDHLADQDGTVKFDERVGALSLSRAALGVAPQVGGEGIVNVQLGLFRAGGIIASGGVVTLRAADIELDGFIDTQSGLGSVTFGAGSNLNVELNGPQVGKGYDQLNVTGTVDLSGSTLNATLGFTPAAGATFVIINNDGNDPITTTFVGLPQDSLLKIGGSKFHILYDFNNGGGQSNDVALIANRPPVINTQNFTVGKTATAGTAIGTVVANDADSAVTFLITAGNSSKTFALDPISGQLKIDDATALASTRSFSLTVEVTDDAGVTKSALITINVLGPEPDAPSDADGSNRNRNDGLVPEAAIAGTRVGITLSATDPQKDDVFYRLTDDAGGRFTVDPLTGVVTVKTSHLLNFAKATQHTIRAQAVDASGNASPEATFGIDVVEVPVNALPLASILPSRVTIVEGDSDDPGHRFISFLVKLNKPSTETVQIDFSTRVGDEPGFIRPDGIPEDASFATDVVGPWDFFRSSGRLVFDPGVTEQTVRVQLHPDDDPAEVNELFFVQLTSPVNARLADGQSIAVAEILEDDSVPQVIVENAQVLEGAAPGQKELVFRLKLVGDFALGLTSATVDFATDDVPIDTAIPDVDYTAVTGTLTFTEGVREQEVRVPITGDLDDEADETLSLRFTNAVSLGLSRTFAVGTIINDDSADVVVSITPSVSKVREGHSGTQQVELFVTLIGQPTTDVVVNYTTLDHHAIAGSDYVAVSGTVTFTLADIAAGLSQKSIFITVNGDTDIELDEGFAVSLSLPTPLPDVSLDPSDSLARVVLRNDDQAILTEDADELFADLLTDLVRILEAGGDAKDNPALVAEMERRAVQIAQSLGLTRAIILIIDPVDFVLTDPGDRQSGYTEGTGSINQIPGTYYSGDGAVELLIVPLPADGTYNVQLAGLGGDFNASVTIVDGDRTTSGVVSDFTGQFFQVGDLTVQFGEGRIPIGLGLAAAHSGAAASAVGVVGAFGHAEFRLALASAFEQASSEGLDLDDADSRSTGLMFWLSVSAQVLRKRVIEPLWQSLGTPLDGLLGEGGFTRITIPSELVDQFWSQVGQTLTGVPSGIYRLGNMLESVIPTLIPRRTRLAPPRSGDQGQPNSAPGNNGVKTRRSSLERPRVTPPNGQVQPPSKPNATKDKSAQTPDAKKTDGQQFSTSHTRWPWFTFKDEKSTKQPVDRRGA